jgi:anti-sigma regulatory factor (Ser/Thr protein kinase)
LLRVVNANLQNGSSDSVTLRLMGGPHAAAKARGALAGLRADIDQPCMETLRLLVTELVTNSIKHAGAETVSLRVLVAGSAVWTEVRDEGPGFDPDTTGTPRQDRSGWGLFLVERLARRWGVQQEEGSTTVWFELARA